MFKKATKTKSRLRLAVYGPSGSGKTWTALELAKGLGTKVAVIDSEHGSASKYADRFEFDTVDLEMFDPQRYIDAIRAAERAGYDVLVIDSLSHAWMGRGGILEQADRGNFAVWKNLTPKHNALIEAILAAKLHIIATMRSKTEYVVEKNEKGKDAPRKVGLGAVQREGMEYEFDVVLTAAIDNTLSVEKTRCSDLHGLTFRHENDRIASALRGWLEDGATPVETEAPKAGEPAPRAASPASAPPAPAATAHPSPQPVQVGPTVDDARAALRVVFKGEDFRSKDVQKRVAHYIGWATGKMVDSLADLDAASLSALITKASAGEMPSEERAA